MNEEIIDILQENNEQIIDNSKEKNALYTERMELEAELSSSDYKISKCMEAVLMGLDMPYDIVEIHRQRKQQRDRINAINLEIKILDGESISEEEALEMAKVQKIEEISEWDISANVNSFTVNGVPMWLNHDQRSRLSASIDVCQEDTMTKYFGGVFYTFPVDTWKQMLSAVELYADTCQTITESHKATVMSLQNIEDVNNYQYQSTYPSKIAFSVN